MLPLCNQKINSYICSKFKKMLIATVKFCSLEIHVNLMWTNFSLTCIVVRIMAFCLTISTKISYFILHNVNIKWMDRQRTLHNRCTEEHSNNCGYIKMAVTYKCSSLVNCSRMEQIKVKTMTHWKNCMNYKRKHLWYKICKLCL